MRLDQSTGRPRRPRGFVSALWPPGRARVVHLPVANLPWLCLALLSLLPGCTPAEPDGGRLALESAFPAAGGQPLLLNDAIRLTFSEPVDPTSVTRESARIVNRRTGVEAQGEWLVDGRLVRFQPSGVRNAALSDGGFRPGQTYRLTLTGFPFLGAIRSTGGASLERSAALDYLVVSVEGGARPGDEGTAVLRDASPGRAEVLRVAAGEPGSADTLPLPWDEALVLTCAEPVDPRSIRPSDYEFRLALGAEPRGLPGPGGLSPIDRSRRDVPSAAPLQATLGVARIELVTNEGERGLSRDGGGESGARLRFHPRSPFPVANGRGPVLFELHLKSGSGGGIRDFSGTAVGRTQRAIRFTVAREDLRSPEGENSYTFDFIDDLDFVPVLDRQSDGTARWIGNGRVDIRFPAAAGDGRSGEIVLSGTEASKDTQATGLSIPAGTETQLTGEGLVVLRAQGRINLDGSLTRRTAGETAPPMWDSSKLILPQGDSEALSTWLKRAAALDHPWTVIIAGGDLVVSGDIDVDTPLLLVAGGRIRGAGRPKAADGQLWLLGEGGGFELPHQHNPNASPNVVPPLVIDEPLHNPLSRPLTFVALSSPVPKGQRPRFWQEAEVLGERGARGDYRVQFLRAGILQAGEDGLAQAARFDEPGLVLDPSSGGGAPVRMRIELVVYPHRGTWEPPFVDRVDLAWSPER